MGLRCGAEHGPGELLSLNALRTMYVYIDALQGERRNSMCILLLRPRHLLLGHPYVRFYLPSLRYLNTTTWIFQGGQICKSILRRSLVPFSTPQSMRHRYIYAPRCWSPSASFFPVAMRAYRNKTQYLATSRPT